MFKRRVWYCSLVHTELFQQVMASEGKCVEISSFVRGYHAYMDIWDPAIDEVLRLENEPTNAQDRRAVAVKKNGQIVGHVPKGFSSAVFYFLNRPCNKGVVKITGAKVNRGGGYGLEVPCVYRFSGPENYLRRLKEVFERLELTP